MEETRLLVPLLFSFVLSFVRVVLFLADLGRRRCWDTPTMPPFEQAGGRKRVYRRKRLSASRGSDKSLP